MAAAACWLEGSFALDDCAGVLSVLQRRAELAGVDLVRMAWRYTALRARTPRAELARGLVDGDEPTWPSAWNQRWAALRAHAAAVLRGEVRNPCPRATQWGGMSIEADRLRAEEAVRAGRWVPVRCVRRTANGFFREVRT